MQFEAPGEFEKFAMRWRRAERRGERRERIGQALERVAVGEVTLLDPGARRRDSRQQMRAQGRAQLAMMMHQSVRRERVGAVDEALERTEFEA